MKRNTPINPQEIQPPLARYSHAVLTEGQGRTLYISGQLGIGPDGCVPDGTTAQARQCFANIDAILKTAGMDRDDVVKISAYVTSDVAFREYMDARDEWIRNLPVPPASTLYMVSGFTRPEFSVEIEIIAST